MNNKIKIYFLENSYNYNGENLNSEKIGGSEKTLINIANSLSQDQKLIIKVFNNTNKPKIINILDSLNKNYSKGLKLFELDLKLTSDGFIVAVHDWENWKKNSN